MCPSTTHHPTITKDLPLKPSKQKRSLSRRLSVQMGETTEEVFVGLARWKWKANFIIDTVAGVDLLGVILASTLVSVAINTLDPDHQLLSFLSSSTPAVSTLGAFYSFALVFRTNICYARWWEGRVLWGTLIVLSIRISQQGRLWLRDEQLSTRIDCMGITFAYACKALLRGNSLDDEEEDGGRLVQLGILEQEELDFMARQKAWQPYYCIDVMRSIKNQALAIRASQDDIVSDHIRSGAFIELENTVCGLASAVGGCIRVQSTGLPVAYDDILNTIGGIFFIIATFAWAPKAGYYNPVIIFLIYLVVKMIIGVGNDMEDPFGDDPSDLPLEKFCATVERQINAIEERTDIISYNLADGPVRSSGKLKRSFNSVSDTSSDASMSETDSLLGTSKFPIGYDAA